MNESTLHGLLACVHVVALGADGARLSPGEGSSTVGELAPGFPVALSIARPDLLARAYGSVLEAGATPVLLNPQLPPATARALAGSLHAQAWLHATEGHHVQREDLSQARAVSAQAGHLVCTSGTTGHGATPSVYFFSALSSLANARAHLASLGFGEGTPLSRVLLPMPLSHAFGLVAGLWACAARGASLFACAAAPDPSTLLTVLERERIELLYLTPPLLRMLLKRARGRALGHLPALRAVSVGSGPVTRDELRGLMRCFPGARTYFTYGLTELGPRVSTFAAGTHAAPHRLLAQEPERAAPIGEPLLGVSMHVAGVGEDGVGELVVRTPFQSAGRWCDGKLLPLDAEGGFHTRDAARLTPEGQVELLGRTDGTIVRGGTNVYPTNVECVADRVPGVLGSCLVGKASPVYGQVPVLVVEVDAAHDAARVKRELEAALVSALAPSEVPVEVRVAALPRTALGKVRRGDVQAMIHPRAGHD